MSRGNPSHQPSAPPLSGSSSAPRSRPHAAAAAAAGAPPGGPQLPWDGIPPGAALEEGWEAAAAAVAAHNPTTAAASIRRWRTLAGALLAVVVGLLSTIAIVTTLPPTGNDNLPASASAPAPSDSAPSPLTPPDLQQAPCEAPQEPRPVAPASPNDVATCMLDLVFCVDATGSMSSYIRAAQQNIKSIVQQITDSENCDVRFGLVAYRDHPPQDSTYVTNVYPFTHSPALMQKHVDALSARGGGDGPEAVAAALYEVLHMPWRPGSTRVTVIIADAPPHGLERGDSLPNGDPDGRDPVQIARQMLAAGIVIYSVACEPALSRYQFATDFFQGIATITKGQFLPLSSANLLADVIIGGAKQQLSLERLMAEVARRAAEVKASDSSLPEAEVARKVAGEMRERGAEAYNLEVEDLYEANAQSTSNVVQMLEAESLAFWVKSDAVKPAERRLKRAAATTAGSGAAAPQRVAHGKSTVSAEQVERMYDMAKARLSSAFSGLKLS